MIATALLFLTAVVVFLGTLPNGRAAETGRNPQEHWAFKAPTRPPLPTPRPASFIIRNPVDAFVLAELEKRQLTPSPEATKEVLLRRVYLDLIGLPPTREQLLEFLGDSSPDAYERLVQRLLGTSQYAERWTRHWMDIWRYADWYGRRHVPDVWNSAPQVWRWRDWIVRSLNADQGYDRMLIEMLAADEVAPDDDQARVATGYLVRNWYALNPNQWLRDVVEHTGKAFLGLTFNCAHCHDHKYDPITQKDYFQFRAFFEPLQVRQDWVEGEPDPGPFQKYEYGSPRKVITNGMVSVFDEKLDAKTFIYLRGDERTFPEGKPSVEPAMPAFLLGDALKPQRMNLPAVAHYPGLKPFIQEAETLKRRKTRSAAKASLEAAQQTLQTARNQFADLERTNHSAGRAKFFVELLTAEATVRNQSNQVAVAQADWDALEARIAADQARFAPSPGERDGPADRQNHARRIEVPQLTSDSAEEKRLASQAARAERFLALRKAEAKLGETEAALELLEAEQAFGSARRRLEGTSANKEDTTKAENAFKKLREQTATARNAVEIARTALETNRTAYTPLSQTYPPQSTGRRRALASWIVSRENPLTARVAENHIWARHFHSPLVASVFDFGRNGTPPTHPELLDWLAVEFMEHGWSMKHLHRLIVTSSAYRQTSSSSAQASRDPENHYLWRMNPGQMEAEVLRDSMLFLADELDQTPVGYPLANADGEKSYHRTLYFECFPEPNGQSQFAELFDPPNPTECYRRRQSIVPHQALALSNSKLSQDRSRALARRLDQKLASATTADEPAFIIAAYQHLLARRPTAAELDLCRGFLAKQAEATTTAAAARASLIHALFNHNDFITIR